MEESSKAVEKGDGRKSPAPHCLALNGGTSRASKYRRYKCHNLRSQSTASEDLALKICEKREAWASNVTVKCEEEVNFISCLR